MNELRMNELSSVERIAINAKRLDEAFVVIGIAVVLLWFCR